MTGSPAADRSRDWGLRPAGSARQGGRALCRRQRCLISSPADCLISSTMVSISARMAVLLGGYVIGCGVARNAPSKDCRRPRVRPSLTGLALRRQRVRDDIGEDFAVNA